MLATHLAVTAVIFGIIILGMAVGLIFDPAAPNVVPNDEHTPGTPVAHVTRTS